jgi:hypothetical protein
MFILDERFGAPNQQMSCTGVWSMLSHVEDNGG